MIKKVIETLINLIFYLGLNKMMAGFKSRHHIYRLSKIKGRLRHAGSNINIQDDYIVFNPMYISIGDNFSALYNLRLEAIDYYEQVDYKPEIIIGNNVSFNTDIHIGCIDKVIIGNNVLFASKIYISDHSHGEINKEELKLPPSKRRLTSKGPVVIGDNVWVGEGVSILSGVTIGENSVIGTNSVVTKSIPSNCVAAGIPARIIRVI